MKKVLLAVGITAILALVSLATLQIVASTIDTPTPPVAQSMIATAPLQPPTVEELLRLVNEERAMNNIAPLVTDQNVQKAAQLKADDMKQNGYSHINSDGRHGFDYIKDTGKECTWVSENIDAALTSKEAVDEWVASPSHYKAMINSRYEETGFGVSNQGEYFYIVQHFCDIN